MNAQQIQLVQSTFEHVKPIAGLAADLFYERLFELDPRLRPLFSSDLREQKAKLVSALALVVAGLHQPDKILPAVRHLGQKHAAYGVRPDDYRTVGAALLWTLEQGLGEAFTPEVEEAWAAAYGLLADTMQQAAYELEPA